MIFKIKYEHQGAHTHCTLYSARQPNTTWATCGTFCIDKSAFEDLRIVMPGIFSWEFVPDPRDPDPSREGIFQYYNCWKCDNGRLPCACGTPTKCHYPHARND